ncbi:MAG: 5'/3'-nucleotidase SurE, partial [Candidatus Eisenbacteria bacterium]|nr:5'/3'-nucleotidase SurE [Candidatus Eisenbacteria bacterium]
LVLLTNDDGVGAEGIGVLRERLRCHAEVVVCAPEQNCSATGHKLTIDRPIRFSEVAPGVHAVDGTPVDCIVIALHCILDRSPDVVLSGINHGPNLGQDVFYSGTVAAALEAAMAGIPAAALSLASRDSEHLPLAADVGLWLAQFLAGGQVPTGVILNVNVPGGYSGLRATRLGRRQYRDFVTPFHGPNGQRGCWIGGGHAEWEDDEGSDHAAVAAGLVSVTPLGQDLTRTDLVDLMSVQAALHGG